jgi:hypothetical protein
MIIFDELNMYNPNELTLIHNFMLKNNHIRYGSTGDRDQIESFGYELNNIDNMENYIEKCINYMFPNQINLEIIKRQESDEDKVKLKKLKKDIFNLDNNDIIKVLKKYLRPDQFIYKMDQLRTKENICYFNYQAEKINKFINERIKKPTETISFNDYIYYKGLDIIGKKYIIFKNIKDTELNIKNYENEYTLVKTLKLGINHKYKILDINDKHVLIGTIYDKEMIIIDIEKIKNVFFTLCKYSTFHPRTK